MTAPTSAPLIAFLCGASDPPSRARFEQACASWHADSVWLDPHEVGPIGELERLPDVVISRSGGHTDEIALNVVHRFEAAGVLCLPSAETLATVSDRWTAAQALVNAGLPVPHTVSTDDAPELPEAVSDRLGYPVVVKARGGMRGEGVALAHDETELASAMEAVGGAAASPVIQAFVGDGSGEDVRVMVVFLHALGAIRRTPVEGEFRANVHQGAQATSQPLDLDMVMIASSAAEALGLPFAGVDLIRHEETWYVIEVNSAPGFEAFEEATGVDVADAIVGFALRLSRQVA